MSMIPLRFRSVCCLGILSLAAGLIGCAEEQKTIPPRYTTLPPKVVPAFLQGSILERVDMASIDPSPVSNYGLVSNLNDTGDSTASTNVREYMHKELSRHRLPSDLLKNKQVAIVTVAGLIPPGARAGQWMDVYVNCIEGNNTTSLVHGTLFQTECASMAQTPMNPAGERLMIGRR